MLGPLLVIMLGTRHVQSTDRFPVDLDSSSLSSRNENSIQPEAVNFWALVACSLTSLGQSPTRLEMARIRKRTILPIASASSSLNTLAGGLASWVKDAGRFSLFSLRIMNSREAMSTFKVIIVGGSIAGLTLANILERYGIDYVVLEKHALIAPQLGASIGLLPHGERILDQLGIFARVEKMSMPMEEVQMQGPDGLPMKAPDLFGPTLRQL